MTDTTTASSARQAERYAEELRWRREQGKVPGGVTYISPSGPGRLYEWALASEGIRIEA